MKFISYIFGTLLIYSVSILPFHLLYLFSDFLYLVLYRLLKYRKKVVFSNLRSSFPEMSEEEIEGIAKRFYHHFCDILVETFKTFTISKKELRRRVRLVNPELLKKFEGKGKSLITVTGHFNNWEWTAQSLSLQSSLEGIGIYKTLSNPYFDKLMRRTRTRFNLRMISTKEVREFFKQKNELFNIGFIADQWPSNPKKAHWTLFLNQETPVFTGAERYARAKNLPVLYAKIIKVKRGHYNIVYIPITEDPQSEEEGSITEKHCRLLEECIREHPEFWLWTHRRWKKSKKEVFEESDGNSTLSP